MCSPPPPPLRLFVRLTPTCTLLPWFTDQGLAEAGVDGGGVFREFLSDVLKTGFGEHIICWFLCSNHSPFNPHPHPPFFFVLDPDAGFFKATVDQRLYPNPQAHIVSDAYQRHFEFLGRMLGKALYDGMLLDIPFAGFFLAKILQQRPSFNALASLDPVMYKNLLFLKHYSGNVEDLDLDFTVSVGGDLGSSSEAVELVPGGKDIAVTNDNRIQYIFYMANYRLNVQIARQCEAFRRGIADVVDLDWLSLFDFKELDVRLPPPLHTNTTQILSYRSLSHPVNIRCRC